VVALRLVYGITVLRCGQLDIVRVEARLVRPVDSVTGGGECHC
jgi:hypothetical protein